MPLSRARALSGPNRSTRADRQLGIVLAFVAGATNAGGFLAVQQYTSHMTGIVSAMADNLALGAYELVGAAAVGLLSFVVGAACSAVMVNYARRHRMHSEYALPLLVEAFLLLGFGLLGARLARTEPLFVPFTVMLLCFIMGLQNAVITKLSNAVIRTTHITGIVTDIGIELGKFFYWNGPRSDLRPIVLCDRARLGVLTSLALSFFVGGVVGAFGFTHFGYVSTVPLAVLLIGLAGVPAYDDLVAAWRRRKSV
ncbi:MAG: YoaK family protein [Burkholderiales bacterium]